MKSPALLIVDMQNDFVLDNAPMNMPGAKGIIPNVKKVLEAFRKREYPVFHIVRVHRSDGSDVEAFRRDLFRSTPFAVEVSPGAEIIRELTPRPGEWTIRKTRMSAFMNTDLDMILRSAGLDTVYITGIQTPNCIRTTAFDAAAYGYQTILVEDAVAARSDEIHQANCRDMANIGIKLVKTDKIGELIQGH
jgi:nicotinamidase-related amidase